MGKKHGPEEIIGKLHEAEIILAQGGTTGDAWLISANIKPFFVFSERRVRIWGSLIPSTLWEWWCQCSLIQDKVDGQRSGQIICVARVRPHEAEHPGRGRCGEVPGWGSIAHRNWPKAGLTELTKGVLAVLSVGGWCLLPWRSCQGASPLLTLSVGYIVGYVRAIISIIH
jgi:hypothetical protein